MVKKLFGIGVLAAIVLLWTSAFCSYYDCCMSPDKAIWNTGGNAIEKSFGTWMDETVGKQATQAAKFTNAIKGDGFQCFKYDAILLNYNE